MKLTPSQTNVWLAALIDGEGSVMLTKRIYSKTAKIKRNEHYRAVVSICNTNYKLMEALIENTGITRIYKHRVNGDPRTPMKRAMWTWRLTSQDIQKWLPRVMPYLVLKQEQAMLLMAAIEYKKKRTPTKGINSSKGSEEYRLRMVTIYDGIRRLNTTGRTMEKGSC